MRWLNWWTPPGIVHPLSGAIGKTAVVALGGGGARGLAHLGAISEIAKCQVRIDRMVGVSIGSLVGALWCLDGDIDRAQGKAIELLRSPTFQRKHQQVFGGQPHRLSGEDAGMFASYGRLNWYGRVMQFLSAHRRFNRAVTSSSLIPQALLRETIDSLVPDVDLKDLKHPLSIVCVDLLSGQRIVLERGSVRLAVLASMSIPGFFPPVPWGNMLLCDIGVFDSLPNTVARSYASDLTIGVDVGQDRLPIKRCDTAIEVMMRMQDIGEQMLRRHVHHSADCVIRPDVGHIAWFDFSEPEKLIEAGRVAAHQQLRLFAECRCGDASPDATFCDNRLRGLFPELRDQTASEAMGREGEEA